MAVPVPLSVQRWLSLGGGPLSGSTGEELPADTEKVVAAVEKARPTDGKTLLKNLVEYAELLKLVVDKGKRVGVAGVMYDDELGLTGEVLGSHTRTVGVIYSAVIYSATLIKKEDNGTCMLKFSLDGPVEEWDQLNVRNSWDPRLLNGELCSAQGALGFRHAVEEELVNAQPCLAAGIGAVVIWLEPEDATSLPKTHDPENPDIIQAWIKRKGVIKFRSVLHSGFFVDPEKDGSDQLLFLPMELVISLQREWEDHNPFCLINVLKNVDGARIRKTPHLYQGGGGGGSEKKKAGRAGALPRRTPSRESFGNRTLSTSSPPRPCASSASTPKGSPIVFAAGHTPTKETKGSRAEKLIAHFHSQIQPDQTMEELHRVGGLAEDIAVGVGDLRRLTDANTKMLVKVDNAVTLNCKDQDKKALVKDAVREFDNVFQSSVKKAGEELSRQLETVTSSALADFSRKLHEVSRKVQVEFGEQLAVTVQSNIGGRPLVLSVDGGEPKPVAQVKGFDADPVYKVPLPVPARPRTSSPVAGASVSRLAHFPHSPILLGGPTKPKKARRDTRAGQGLAEEYWQEPEKPLLFVLRAMQQEKLPSWLLQFHHHGLLQRSIPNFASPVSRDAQTFEVLRPALLYWAEDMEVESVQMRLNVLRANVEVVWMAFRSALRVGPKAAVVWDAAVALHSWLLATAKHLVNLGLYEVADIEANWPTSWRPTEEEEGLSLREYLAKVSPKPGTSVFNWIQAFQLLFAKHEVIQPQTLTVGELKRGLQTARSSFLRGRKPKKEKGNESLDTTTSSMNNDEEDFVEPEPKQ